MARICRSDLRIATLKHIIYTPSFWRNGIRRGRATSNACDLLATSNQLDFHRRIIINVIHLKAKQIAETALKSGVIRQI